ncbi:MAG: hypothetical protein VYD70_08965 [Planctomycetota bacterium]|nr:hypothetical protein [Planctomycetota bacterium]
MQELWQKNKKLMIQALAAMMVFLLISTYARSVRGDHEKDLVRHKRKAQELSHQLQERDGRVDVERKSRAALEERNKDLLRKLSISSTSRHRPPEDESSVSTEFKRAKDLVWNNFRERANRIGLVTPAEIPNFDERGDLSMENWTDRYRLLEVLDRFLQVCLQCGIPRIDRVVPSTRTQESFRDTNKVLVRYPIEIKLLCSPDQLSDLIVRFQVDGAFLSIEPITVVAEKSNSGRLEALLQVVGLDVEDPREEIRRGRRSSLRGIRRGN